MDMVKQKEGILTTRNMTRISILAVIAVVIMFLQMSVGFAPPFLKLDLSDMPGLIGAFAMGPVAGVLVQLIKNILNLLLDGTTTGGVGELSNFIVGSAYVFTAGFIYHRKEKTFKRAILGMVMGVLAMTFFATFSNYFVVFPLYAKLMPLDQIIEMGASVNRLVVDYESLILYAVVPFNLLKGTVNAIATTLIYKKVSPILKD